MRRCLAFILIVFVFASIIVVPSASAETKVRLLWFSAYTRDGGFVGAVTGYNILPNDAILSEYPNIEVTLIKNVTELPPDWYNYDILVIADTGFPENLTKFKGKLLITIDSAIAPFFYWFTGSNQYGVLWDYTSRSSQKWISPYTDTEVVTPGDSVIYKEKIEEISWLKTHFDVAYAVLVENRSKITVALFEVNKNDIKFYWLHMGPYDAWHPDTPNRQTFLVLDLSEKVLSLSAKPKPKQEEVSLPLLTFMYYVQYNKTIEEFNTLYEEAVNKGIDNETLNTALHYKEIAIQEYTEATKYGPILANLADIRVFVHLRKAVIALKQAISILENALS